MSITLAGSQIAVEAVDNWLAAAPTHHFAIKKTWPMRYSQDGFDNLARGQCDLACADRLLNDREIDQFGQQPVAGRRIAFYGYALYVHHTNKLDAIFAGHLEMVLQQRITDWHELAGDAIPDLQGPINVYGLSKSTRAGMQLSHMARVWFNKPTWTVLDTDAEVIDRVARDPLALGFASLGYDDGVRYLGLRMQRTAPAALPSLEKIESERYGLAKVIYVYYLDPPSPQVQATLDYLASDAGQAAISASDFWPIAPDRAPLKRVP